jgi:redox-sensing transcriptional repressor
MKDINEISSSVITRLPRYYRFLCELQKNGTVRISSKELAEIMGSTASQIRQDFNCFGGFGQQGYGYNIEQLVKELSIIMGLDNLKSAIIIGAGNMGKAVASQMSFETMGFKLMAVFDKNPTLSRLRLNGLPVKDSADLEVFCTKNKIDMAVLCIPIEATPGVVDTLISLGINSFWNFSHYDIHSKYPDATVENVHLSDSLMKLSYNIKNSGR